MNEKTLVDFYKIKLNDLKTNVSNAKKAVADCAEKIEKELALGSHDNLSKLVNDRDAIEKRKLIILKELDALLDFVEKKIPAKV